MTRAALAITCLILTSCGKSEKGDPDKGDDGPRKQKLAKLQVGKIAFERFPEWAMKHTATACPASIDELAEPADLMDPWGHKIVFLCGPNLPAGVKGGAGALSLGEDGREGTADDIKSW